MSETKRDYVYSRPKPGSIIDVSDEHVTVLNPTPKESPEQVMARRTAATHMEIERFMDEADGSVFLALKRACYELVVANEAKKCECPHE